MREQLSKDGHLKLTTEVVGREPKLAIFHISVDRMWGETERGKAKGKEEGKFVRNYTNMTSARPH